MTVGELLSRLHELRPEDMGMEVLSQGCCSQPCCVEISHVMCVMNPRDLTAHKGERAIVLVRQ